MKQELRGWKVCYTPSLKQLIDSPRLNSPQKLLSSPSARRHLNNHDELEGDDKSIDIVVLSEVSLHDIQSRASDSKEEWFTSARPRLPLFPSDTEHKDNSIIDLTKSADDFQANDENCILRELQKKRRPRTRQNDIICLIEEFDHCKQPLERTKKSRRDSDELSSGDVRSIDREVSKEE